MNARIRAKIAQARNPRPSPVNEGQHLSDEVYFTPAEVAARLKLHKDTVKNLMRTETTGVIRIGRLRTLERYSASAVERLVRRLERGEDPRYTNRPC